MCSASRDFSASSRRASRCGERCAPTCPWRIPKLTQNQTLRYDAKMRDLVVLFVHLVVTIARLTRPGGIRSVVAESILINHQLQILNRNRKRAPNLRSLDRIIVGFSALFIRRARLIRSAVTVKPSTLLHLHDLLRNRKYRLASPWTEDRVRNSSCCC